MYDTAIRNQFIELRGKGLSLQSIARRLKVSKRTLVEWHRQERNAIRVLRAAEVEAVMERTLRSVEWNLFQLTHQLERIENELYMRDLRCVTTEELFRLAALVRAEIRKVCLQNEPMLEASREPSAREHAPESTPAKRLRNQNCTISSPPPEPVPEVRQIPCPVNHSHPALASPNAIANSNL